MQHVQISDLHIFDYCSYPRLLLCTFIMLCLLINVNKNDFCKTYECLINRLSSETKASMPKLHMLLCYEKCDYPYKLGIVLNSECMGMRIVMQDHGHMLPYSQ